MQKLLKLLKKLLNRIAKYLDSIELYRFTSRKLWLIVGLIALGVYLNHIGRLTTQLADMMGVLGAAYVASNVYQKKVEKTKK